MKASVSRATFDPAAPDDLIAALGDSRREVVHGAANALKHLQRRDASALQPFARQLLRAASTQADLRARWNLIEIVGRLRLRGRDRALAIDLLFEGVAHGSAFLRVHALQALADMAADDRSLRRTVRAVVAAALDDPSAAMRARARKLAKSMNPG